MNENSKARVMVVQVCEECGTEFPIWRRKSNMIGLRIRAKVPRAKRTVYATGANEYELVSAEVEPDGFCAWASRKEIE